MLSFCHARKWTWSEGIKLNGKGKNTSVSFTTVALLAILNIKSPARQSYSVSLDRSMFFMLNLLLTIFITSMSGISLMFDARVQWQATSVATISLHISQIPFSEGCYLHQVPGGGGGGGGVTALSVATGAAFRSLV